MLLNELIARKTVKVEEPFESPMSYQMPIIENEFEQLWIGNNNVEIRIFIADKNDKELLKALKAFYPHTDPNYHNKVDLKKMEQIQQKTQTPVTSDNKLFKEALQGLNRPVPDPMKYHHFLYPVKGRPVIYTSNLSFENLKSDQPAANTIPIEQQFLNGDKTRMRGTIFVKSKM
eukprot:15339153-Ditylum_brightwellii.AAC.1